MIHSVLLPAAMLVLLAACDKSPDPVTTTPASVAVVAQSPRAPFLRRGENLSVHVDSMPRDELLVRLGELTGTKIAAAGGGDVTAVSVHADDASLRKILAQVFADAPYTVLMEYANLQDSFPASVTVTPYRSSPPSTAVPAAPAPAAVATVFADGQAASPPATPVPDFAVMPEEERQAYFLGQSEDDQIALVFEMEPTPADSALLARLLAREDLSPDVRVEMLDSLSNGEYASSLPGLKVALGAQAPDVVTRAIEVLTELGSAADVPLLQGLASSHADEAVRQSAQDAIDMLKE